jgi:hypothetical protein
MKKLPTLAEVDAYPVPPLLVPRIMKNYNRSREYTEAILREAKRMLWLSQVSGMPVCPSVEIDDAWHEMILFTPYYHAFCRFIGTDYIHHDPTGETPEGSAEESKAAGKSLYDETLENYKKYIGEPDQTYWTP